MDNSRVKYRHELLNDRWAAEVVFPGERGYFVEAGACNGVGGSASWALEKGLGWDGICVEPADQPYAALERYRDCKTDNRCLWDRTGETLTFSFYPTRPGRSGVRSVTPHEAELADAEEQRVEKPTVTLHDLLAEHDAPATVNYVALDLEGAEAQVLGAFDFDGPYKLLAVSVEGYRCDDLMRGAGYVRVTNPFTDHDFERYFVHPELADKLSDYVAE